MKALSYNCLWNCYANKVCLLTKSTFLLHFQDTTVTELAQDLAKKLGLKGRKAYVSPQTESTGTDGESLGETSSPAGDVGDAGNICICIWWLGPSFVLYTLRCPPTGWNLLETLDQVWLNFSSHCWSHVHLCVNFHPSVVVPRQPTCPALSASLLLWPLPSLSVTSQHPPWWLLALSWRRAAARGCLPCLTRCPCQNIWRSAAAASSRISWTACWSASQRKLVKWV